MDKNIYEEIMTLIEENTNMPLLISDLNNWLEEDEKNKEIFKLYTLASKLRWHDLNEVKKQIKELTHTNNS